MIIIAIPSYQYEILNLRDLANILKLLKKIISKFVTNCWKSDLAWVFQTQWWMLAQWKEKNLKYNHK